MQCLTCPKERVWQLHYGDVVMRTSSCCCLLLMLFGVWVCAWSLHSKRPACQGRCSHVQYLPPEDVGCCHGKAHTTVWHTDIPLNYAAAKHQECFFDNGTMIISCWKTCSSGFAMRLDHATLKCSPQSLCRVSSCWKKGGAAKLRSPDREN